MYEVNKLLIDNDTGELEYFHIAAYANNPTEPDTQMLHEDISVPYIQEIIYSMDDYIDDLHKKKTLSIVTR